MKRNEIANNRVTIEAGLNSEDQSRSFQNGTLQGVGGGVAITIQTHLEVPKDVSAKGEHEVANWLNTKLSAVVRDHAEFSFEVQVGKDIDYSNETVAITKNEEVATDVMPLHLQDILKKIGQQPQRQDSTNAQLADIYLFANKLGLNDAADIIKQMLNSSGLENKPTKSARIKP